MRRTHLNLLLGTALATLVIPFDAFAGGRGGGYGGGYGGNRGGGGGGYSRGGQGGGSPSFSQPRSPSSSSGGSGNRSSYNSGGSENRSSYGNQAGSDSRSQYGNTSGASNRNPNPNSSNAGAAAGAGYANRNQSPNAGAAAGAGYSNRNQSPNAGAAAAGAGYANRNQSPNAGAAAAGAGYANRNQSPNAGAAAAGAGYANRNQSPNYGAAAAGAGYANRNQSPNYGAAAAGAGYANRNQSPNYGAAAAGAGYANRNQSPNYGAAAAGATYANRNQYDEYHPGMVNGYWNGNGYAGYAATGYGAGVAAWGAGSPMYGWGYSGYSNPYYGAAAGAGGVPQNVAAQQSASAPYNYSQPISTTAPPPEQGVAGQATSAFDQAREAFKAGDYAQALQLDQQAIAQMPNDTTMHEFLSLVYFAQGKYDQAAAPLYAVLSVGPGWDWTTLSGMYSDVAAYTSQLRALESNLRANPDSAPGHFVLAYQYLAQGHIENGVAQLKQVVRLQPADTLSAQLIAQLQPSSGTQPAPAAPAAAQGKLAGNWTATPGKDAKISLAIQDDGRFTWAATNPGKPATTIVGGSTLADGVLTLSAQGSQDGALTGKVAWQDPDHFTFQLLGAQPSDPGLTFAR